MGKQQRKKILHVLNTNSYSGAENIVITIMSNLSNKFDMVYASKEGPIQGYLCDKDLSFASLNGLSVKEIRRLVREVKPDVIHAHDFTATVITALSFIAVPIISHIHSNPVWIKTVNLRTLAFAFAACRTKEIITVSESVINEFRFSGFFKKKMVSIGNPIDVNEIQTRETNENKAYNYDVVFIGRLSEEKNPLQFIKIINKVRQEINYISVAIVGDGNLKSECEKMIKNLNLESNIQMLGFLKNPYDILAKAKVLCMTSNWEGFGLVAVEAMSFGIPVIAKPVGGLCDIITKNSGYLCSSEDEYKAVIIQLVTDQKKREEKSIGAKKRAYELNNIETYMESLSLIYLNLINKE